MQTIKAVDIAEAIALLQIFQDRLSENLLPSFDLYVRVMNTKVNLRAALSTIDVEIKGDGAHE
jgi:hypothetical protein